MSVDSEVNDRRIDAREAWTILGCGKTHFYTYVVSRGLLKQIPYGARKRYSLLEVKALAEKGYH
jgi:predicted DNA-binding transcriptional regulator AlpA